MSTYWTVDLGATSGRVMSVQLADERVVMHEELRFANQPLECGGELFWDLETLQPAVAARIGTGTDVPVMRSACHDTAAAVAAIGGSAIPGSGGIAFVSCGTWALAGVETTRPVLSEAAFTGGFTNELGANGQLLFIRNLTGLWLLEQAFRTWRRSDPALRLDALLAQAAARPDFTSVIDVGDAGPSPTIRPPTKPYPESYMASDQLGTAAAEDFVEVDTRTLLDLVNHERAGDADVERVFGELGRGGKRPSVEAMLHAICLSAGRTSVVGHTHPVPVNIMLCSPHAERMSCDVLFPEQVVILGRRPVFVPYLDPGLTLARAVQREMLRQIELDGAPPKVIYLGNHGICPRRVRRGGLADHRDGGEGEPDSRRRHHRRRGAHPVRGRRSPDRRAPGRDLPAPGAGRYRPAGGRL